MKLTRSFFNWRFVATIVALPAAVLANAYDSSLSDLPWSEVLQGQDSRTEGTVVTYNIPTSDWPAVLKLNSVRGGDGGRARAFPQLGANRIGNGGGGALLSAQFQIDPTAPNALRPGGSLRFIVGNKGEDRSRLDVASSGGGGGSAVLYRAPEEDAGWEILVVAGGGGGGVACTLVSDTFEQDGRDASTSVDGSSGKQLGGGTGRDGGINGGAGVSIDFGWGGGGGSHNRDSKTSYDLVWGSSGKKGGVTGSAGGIAAFRGSYGGFGFGSGGGGYLDSDEKYAKGGGGGGYSGGGAGGNNGTGEGAGGGGGSYVNPIATAHSINSQNSDRANGLIAFQALPFPGLSMPGPTITPTGADPFNVGFGGNYTERGFTAVDIYGNEASLDPTTSGSIESRIPGSYTITYGVTDIFGNRGTGTRTVIVRDPNPPTFTVGNNFEVAEDSGAFSQGNFITDFNGRDPGDSILGYTVTNDNNALFAVQPSIDNAGTLTFTPASNLYGTATVTVIATDTNEYPEFADSEPQTFEITITGVDDPPVITPPSSPTVAENVSASFVFFANDPFGGAISYQIVGDDSSFFSLNQSGPSLIFSSAQDYEAPADFNGDNVYDVTIVATGSDGTSSVPVQVQLLNVSQTPTDLGLSENRVIEGNLPVGVLSATAEEGEVPLFTVTGGVDQAAFSVSGSSLVFKSAPDHSNPSDSDGDNIYHVELTASSGDFDSEPKMFSITVYAEDNEAPEPPGISNNSVPENSQTVGTLMSSDPNGEAVSYSIQGGADAALFVILNGDTLAFVTPPDFENPTDQNGDNIYEVSLVASDRLKTSEEGMLQIAVSDVIDEPANDILIDGQSLASLPVEENLVAGTVLGVLSVVDVEPGDSHILDLATDSSGRFAIVNGNELIATGSPTIDYESDNFHVIRIRATDSGGNAYTKRIEIPVINLEEGSVLQRDGFTLQTNTNSRWLDFGAAFNKKVTVMEGRVERGEVDETDYNWQFATWDEVMEFYKEASLDWYYDTTDGRWAFLFPDNYFNQDGLSSGFFFDSFAVNRDGSYGGNKYIWDRDNPRILHVFAQGDFVSSLYDQLYRDLRIQYVVAGSQYESLLQMDGELYTATRADVFMLIDRTSGVGFSEWASGQERSSDFSADDNDDGQAVGLDYVFGEQKPMEMLSSNEIVAPANTWRDAEISLLCSNDLQTWTTLLTYRGGSIVQTPEELQQHGIAIEDGVITHGNGGVADQTFYRYRVEQFDESAAQ